MHSGTLAAQFFCASVSLSMSQQQVFLCAVNVNLEVMKAIVVCAKALLTS